MFHVKHFGIAQSNNANRISQKGIGNSDALLLYFILFFHYMHLFGAASVGFGNGDSETIVVYHISNGRNVP